jgi:hypothetical protein
MYSLLSGSRSANNIPICSGIFTNTRAASISSALVNSSPQTSFTTRSLSFYMGSSLIAFSWMAASCSINIAPRAKKKPGVIRWQLSLTSNQSQLTQDKVQPENQYIHRWPTKGRDFHAEENDINAHIATGSAAILSGSPITKSRRLTDC